jgi:hypothetical protein
VHIQDATCGGEWLSFSAEKRRRFHSQKSIVVGFLSRLRFLLEQWAETIWKKETSGPWSTAKPIKQVFVRTLRTRPMKGWRNVRDGFRVIYV